jgi:pimeloyl-ACP methyl ester carboxylesterase
MGGGRFNAPIVAQLAILFCLWASGCCQGTCGATSGLPVAGAYVTSVPMPDAQPAPVYIIRYDKDGTCCNPTVRDGLIGAIRAGGYSDIFLISHGWNNEWEDARTFYLSFFEQYERVRVEHGIANRGYRPLFVGVFWPSTVLVLPSDLPPPGAAGPPGRMPSLSPREIKLVADELPSSNARRLRALVRRGRVLNDAGRRELARILLPVYRSSRDADDEVNGAAGAGSADEIVEVWRQAALGLTGSAPESPATSGATSPSAPGALPAILDDLRWLLRFTTFLVMKDRAGVVGRNGVAALLDEVLRADTATRVHMIGHSYGAKVCLSALCRGDKPRAVNSVLLLQPALSAWCFAADLPDPRRPGTSTGRPGGYRPALSRVDAPIATTFSRNDYPLSRIFHHFVRRRQDVGETEGRGAPAVANPYWALGGFGPKGLGDEAAVIDPMLAAPTRYDFVPMHRVYGLDGSAGAIPGHGGVNNLYTWWVLYSQVR